MTAATPATSATLGICVSTMIPMTVATAGSSDTIRLYVARGKRVSASWSQT
jgi:hypothetical protein